MAQITMSEMLKAGVHFGHQTRRWNPKMKQYILMERNGIHIINLFKSLELIDKAYDFIKATVAHNGTVLFVGTKKQAQEAVQTQATRVNMPYVSERWLGGMLTNFQTVSKRVSRLKELEEMDFSDVHGSGLTKKELLLLEREKDKLEKQLGGIRNMVRTLRDVRRGHQQGIARRRGSPQAGHPGRGPRRHQHRPGVRRLPDSGQR